jgi:hypothetical protein
VVLRSVLQLLVTGSVGPNSLILSTLMIETILSSEMLGLTRATRRPIPEGGILQIRGCYCSNARSSPCVRNRARGSGLHHHSRGPGNVYRKSHSKLYPVCRMLTSCSFHEALDLLSATVCPLVERAEPSHSFTLSGACTGRSGPPLTQCTTTDNGTVKPLWKRIMTAFHHAPEHHTLGHTPQGNYTD